MKVLVDELTYTYPSGITALHGISLAIASGEQVAIIGQNGAGKTTLVKHFNRLLKPKSGTVLIGDWDTADYTIAQLAARVGYVFQNPDDQLFSRTVEQEVAVGPRNLGYPAERVQELVDDALALAELTAQRETNPYDLAPNWRKMVAIASIVAMDTPVVIFDEPTTGQDAAGVARIGRIVDTLAERGKTVITITHDIDFAADHFTRLIALAQGKVLIEGPVQEVIGQEETLAETYVDPPQLTRLGLRLGFPEPVHDVEGFLSTLRRRRG